MSVSNGQAANAATFNGAFVSKTADSTVSGTITQDKESVLKEIATPATPSSGYGKIYFKSDGKLYQLNDAGTETVVGAGAGGGGGVNFISNGGAEDNNTTGWAAYADAAGSSPVDGTGGTANVTISSSGTSPLIGTYSFLMAKDAANRQGQGWSYAFTIDQAYKAKVIQIDFEYLVSSGTFTAGTSSADSDVTLWIYDVTNAVVIQPSSYKLLSNSSSLSTKHSATFQSASNSTSYRLIFHVATTSASAYTLKVDGISVAPEQYVYGTPVTDWQSYSPTLVGFGSPTSVEFYWRRVGDNIEIQGNFTPGTSTATTAQIPLPSGLTINSSKVGTNISVGWGVISATSAASASVLATGGNAYLNMSVTGSASYNASTPQNGNVIASSGQRTTFQARVAVQGWSSSVQTSDTTDTRVVAMRAGGSSAGQSLTAAVTNIIFNTSVTDTHGAYNSSTGIYTVPVTGFYKIFAHTRISTNTTHSLSVYVDGTLAADGGPYVTTQWNSLSAGLYLTAGQQVSIRCDTTVVVSNPTLANTHWLYICRETGPSAIAASETIEASYWCSANMTANTTTPVNFDSKEIDTHNAVTTGSAWKFTAPSAGIYEVSLYLNFSAGTSAFMFISKNGTTPYKPIGYSITTTLITGSTKLRLNAGEYIAIYPNVSSPVAGGSLASQNSAHINILRVGN